MPYPIGCYLTSSRKVIIMLTYEYNGNKISLKNSIATDY